MKRIVLVYGLIAGAIMAIMFLLTTFVGEKIGFEHSMLVGYTTMVIGFTLIFFAIRNYRENLGNHAISFGRAFGIGMLITLVASVIYSLSWMLIHKFMMPDFYQNYAAYQMETMKAAGASAQEILEAQKGMDDMIAMVANPVFEFLFTLLEPLPVGILVTLISSLILRKKAVAVV